MEVLDEGSDTGETVIVEGNGASLTLFEESVVGEEREKSYLGADFFAVSFEEDSVVFGEDCDGCLFEEYTEAVVAQGANSHQVMMELGHNLGGSCWKLGEEEIPRRGGAVGRSTCCSNEDLERAWADVCAWSFESEVVAAGACVGYYGILWCNGRVWSWAKGRGMQTIFSSKRTI